MTLPQNVKDADPNPLATGPTKWRAEHCVTHHYACDCREWEHACEVDRLESRLAAANALLRECYEWLFENLSDGPRVSEGAIEKHYYTPLLEAFHERIQTHLQGAGDEIV